MVSTSDVVSVVGGGWSFRRVNPARLPGHVIGVNESGLLLPQVGTIVTMDRLWTEGRAAKLDTLAGVTQVHVRRSAIQNVKHLAGHAYVHVFENSDRPIGGDYSDSHFAPFSGKLNVLEGNNSGVCALNRAYQMLPRELYLFGFDMCRSPEGEAYWHKPYEWASPSGATKPKRYEDWARQFEHIAGYFKRIGCRVVNVSGVSKIKAFEQRTPEEMGIGI